LLAGLLVLTIPQLADCGVDVFGNVTPIDNPFTYPENEGIPLSGNFIDEDREKNDQPTLEGVYSWDGDSNSVDGDSNSVPTITVGEYAYGMVQVLAPSQLNFADLIIGSNASNSYGNGIVKISGLGATYNSDFEIFDQQLVAILPEPEPEEVLETIKTIRSGLPGANAGFDLTVGETGTGTLLISSGGRAEIHDSIIVGDEMGSNGEITVDGFASYLRGGGFRTSFFWADAVDPHITVIGRQGTGALNITNGANVFSAATFDFFNTETIVGAVVGGDPLSLNNEKEQPDRGGSGTVLIDGAGSLWTIDTGLQLGGFSDVSDGEAGAVVSGINVRYGADVGDATVTVSNGGTLSILNTTASLGNHAKTKLLIGRAGRLKLDTGGQVYVGLADNSDEDVILVNDGVISGSGHINTGLFHNRHLGEVRVGEGDELLITSTSNLEDVTIPILPAEMRYVPLVNYGLIEVHDGEIELTRGEDDTTSSDTPTYQSFKNLRLSNSETTQVPSRGFGLIEAQNATLRFQTGVHNQGLVNFIGGTSRVYGDMTNEVGTPDIDEGLISIVGDDTFVVFNGDLTNSGSIQVGPNALGYTANDFTNNGTLSLVLGERESGNEFSTVLSLGDIDLQGGTLEVTLNQSGANSITPQVGDEYLIMRAAGELSGDFTEWDLPFLGAESSLIPIADLDADIYKLVVQSSSIAIGGDLNGTGIVDFNDVIIWQANAGNPGGLGDINMDNIVNGLDLQIIQTQFGRPGIPLGSASAVVPEPATAVLAWLTLAGVLCSIRRSC
jgi:hypothetical protein